MAVNYPSPINQFSRLIHYSGTEPTGTYKLGSRWNNTHYNPSTKRVENWDGRNCTAAMGAVLIDAHTGGRVLSNPAAIRNAQNDWSGGIGWDDVNVAWSRLFPGNQLILPQAHDWADVIASLKEGRFVGIQGDNDRLGVYSCQVGFAGDHAYGLGGYRTSDSRVLKYDPLCHHASWVPQTQIRAAAEKLALAQRGTRSKLFVALTKIMPPPPGGVTYRYGGEPRFRGRYLARRDDVPVRSGPGPDYPKVAELDHRESFACAQSVQNGKWLGTADGRKWVYREVMWYAGGRTGQETIR